MKAFSKQCYAEFKEHQAQIDKENRHNQEDAEYEENAVSADETSISYDSEDTSSQGEAHD